MNMNMKTYEKKVRRLLSTRSLWNAPDYQEWNELLRKIKNCEDFNLFQGLRIKVTNEDSIVIEGITYRKKLSH